MGFFLRLQLKIGVLGTKENITIDILTQEWWKSVQGIRQGSGRMERDVVNSINFKRCPAAAA